ncbi:hypothetical protein C7441_11058 [Pseudaminobacter salicylatoxidans]|uniref:Uncharacterized protein n=1 Tax=Pseudaminobacter salicylatoxidans TaxID=93369 RepID=A0A316C0I6_PSESE|nr:hypothetical protein [Pseudaminobacter salicylatoxidans]PWJ81526.1 hypothetical protein C7441_11058 [Pseudaminobacter salicylatoxidans]
MRYAMIDAKNRKVWDLQTPYHLSEAFLAWVLRCDYAHRIELNDDLDLWVSAEPKATSFRLLQDGPQYPGNGILCGRTKMDDIKSLPRHYGYEMVTRWVHWPARVSTETRRPIKLRPTGFPQVGLSNPYHRIAQKDCAKDTGNLTQALSKSNAP